MFHQWQAFRTFRRSVQQERCRLVRQAGKNLQPGHGYRLNVSVLEVEADHKMEGVEVEAHSCMQFFLLQVLQIHRSRLLSGRVERPAIQEVHQGYWEEIHSLVRTVLLFQLLHIVAEAV